MSTDSQAGASPALDWTDPLLRLQHAARAGLSGDWRAFNEAFRETAAELSGLRTEVARLREALGYIAEYKMTGTELTLHLDFQAKARDALGPSAPQTQEET